MAERFVGKTLLVTGATSDVGRATVLRLKDEGARLVVTARDTAALEALASTCGRGCATVPGDLRDEAWRTRLGAAARAEGPLHGVFLNAGVAPFRPLDEVTRASFSDCLDVNVVSALLVVQAVKPALAPGASVVLTSSAMQHRPLTGSTEWVASTWAVRGLAAALAVELAPAGVRVNTISHGPIDTSAYHRYGMPEADVAALKRDLSRGTLVGRLGRVEEVADLVATMLAPGFMTGSEVVADGGWALASGRTGEPA